jgi:hypothetical protein
MVSPPGIKNNFHEVLFFYDFKDFGAVVGSAAGACPVGELQLLALRALAEIR